MRYSKVHVEALGYELPPVVVTSEDLEQRLEPMYKKLRIPSGQVESLTGITERRWWDEGYPVSLGAAAAAKKALAKSNVSVKDIGALIYTGVCRENFEPATACVVANEIGITADAFVYDISNACLGVLNGIIDVANRIELGQIKAGLVVSCESSREINEIAIKNMLDDPTMENFSSSLATLTGGSGAAAVLITNKSMASEKRRKLLAATTKAAPEHHRLCRWGIKLSPVALGELFLSPNKLKDAVHQMMEPEAIPSAVKEIMTNQKLPNMISSLLPSEKLPKALTQFMSTDSVSVLKHGVDLGLNTWKSFLENVGWSRDHVDKLICHQVGSGHRDMILRELGVPADKEFSTFKHLGNIGTVSLPLTAAIAEQRGHLIPGDRVGFLGIGSGLNCLMLGWEW